MKKSLIAVLTALIIGFCAAVVTCVQALLATPVSAFSAGNMRVVVDAGHGGIDCGVTGRKTGVKESDLNLSIALALKEELSDAGFEVTLTRKTEGGLYGTTAKGFKKRDMLRRKEIIEECKPNLILSVHQNYYPSSSTRGGQVFYDEKNGESEAFALAVQGRLNALYAEDGVRHRKATKGEFFMLDCYPCPSVIVECGFLSNAADEGLLCKPTWQKRLAEGICGGVMDFFSGLSA